MSYLERFRVRPGARVRLANIDPSFKDRGAEIVVVTTL